jgi:transcriptional regulator with XRE-family HTH domain
MENHIMHWTAKSAADFTFSVGADFIAQVEVKLEAEKIPQKDLAKALHVSEGRVSQILNDPGNLELETIVKCALSLGMKASIVLYDDGDRKKEYGPIHPDIFRISWEKAGKPTDFWMINDTNSVQSQFADAGMCFRHVSFEEEVVASSELNMSGIREIQLARTGE